MGRIAMEILLRKIELPESQEKEEMPISLRAQLHIRESTAPPRSPAAPETDYSV